VDGEFSPTDTIIIFMFKSQCKPGMSKGKKMLYLWSTSSECPIVIAAAITCTITDVAAIIVDIALHPRSPVHTSCDHPLKWPATHAVSQLQAKK
jgi:hypothetical protein